MDPVTGNGYGRAKRTSRVPSACQRCRRQKLKCDRERPCALCTRTGVTCISENRPTQRKRRTINRDEVNSLSQPSQETIAPTKPLVENSGASLRNVINTPGNIADNSRKLSDDTLNYQNSGNRKSEWVGHTARTSSVGMTQEIIDQFSPKTVLGSSTSALPGGSKSDDMLGPSEGSISINAFNFEFPPKPVADFLLETYLGAVHWFMMVFHEATFRRQYESILMTRGHKKSKSKLLLILLVLSLGAHYTTDERVKIHCATFDIEQFRKRSLAKVEEQLLGLLDVSGVESVQICVLLGSFYLYHGRPNLAYVILGSGIRCGQIMGLYRESSWREVSEMDKEERRRTFWALYVFDRFASIVYGKPCSIQGEEVDVQMPQNLKDSTIQHPHFHTIASMPNGMPEPVTTFAYVTYKIKLYQIASPIVADVYFHRDADLNSLATKVMSIDKQLKDWFASLPPELKLGKVCRKDMKDPSKNARLFMLQALALQLAYDNVQILLHRPSLSQNIEGLASVSNNKKSSPWYSNMQSPARSHKAQAALLTSRDHCWESAIQSSNLGVYDECLQYARETHAAAFLGINLFTASMVLCVFALSNPISTQAQLAKQAVARIMSLSRFLENRSVLSGQTNQVLRDLVHLILEKERKVMLFADKEPIPVRTSYDPGVASKDVVSLTASPIPAEGYGPYKHSQIIPQSSYENPNAPFSATLMENVTSQNYSMPDFGNFDFDDGIATLQEAMFPPFETPESWNVESDMANSNGPHHSGDRILNTNLDISNSIGQTWLWNPS